ncbi:sulfurtransferase [Verticiella sediminum]|uniref:tRNA uridine(34) hydroxylase n=1 Tax=Verticiella sediminum TaxID=1247510 RepID=A0A556AFD0_9BURK|nr:sulfurtransferase [Verticiella sediminum]TSH91591.1 sulfurtransferase [Verticiella sediminum]
MPAITNIAAYRFVALDDLPALRERLYELAHAQGLSGTVLLAPEGINLFLAGAMTGIEAFLGALGEDARFASLDAKYSESATVPFRRLRVRIKREIIRMDHPAIRPVAGRAPALAPRTLRRWLDTGRDDDGREVVLLDTRNAFEADTGTFENALDFRIGKFTEFPAAVLARRDALRDKTVVTFCTGGIRCEKAAIYMAEAGIENVLQLDGGILKYFEETDGAGYRGACFVFDERIALDKSLAPVAA